MIRDATQGDLGDIRKLFREYESFLDFDLCFQSFEHELDNLPGQYAPPKGCLLVAIEKTSYVGCIAIRPLEAGICEMKRLYVRPEGRGQGLGRQLAEAVISRARSLGYHKMKLDTVGKLQAAITLYRDLGFQPCAPYCDNPQPDVEYFELALRP